MESVVRLIVGLGNPAASYDGTRHNIGRELIDLLATETKAKFVKSRQTEHFRLASFFGLDLPAPLFVVKLNSYMNESGIPLKSFMMAEKIEPQQILVIIDDFMIKLGRFRLRSEGSSGGHNGLNSIIEQLGTSEFGRLRVGIGPVPANQDPADFVLQAFTKEEANKLKEDCPKMIKEGLPLLFSDGYSKAMSFINSMGV